MIFIFYYYDLNQVKPGLDGVRYGARQRATLLINWLQDEFSHPQRIFQVSRHY